MDGEAPSLLITSIPPAQVDLIWPRVKPMLERACEISSGRVTVEECHQKIKANEHELWVLHTGPHIHAAVTLTIVTYTAFKVLSVMFLGGGDLDLWRDALDQALVRAAQRAKCKKIEWIGRPGWQRVAAAWGYRPMYVTIEKDVPDV